MDNFEAYSYLFSDSLFANLIFSSNRELVVDVMKNFDGYNNSLIMVLSAIGHLIANICNYFLGKIVSTVKQSDKILEKGVNQKINKFLPVMLFLSCAPVMGAIGSLFLGLFRVKLKYNFILYMFCGNIIYYSMYLLGSNV